MRAALALAALALAACQPPGGDPTSQASAPAKARPPAPPAGARGSGAAPLDAPPPAPAPPGGGARPPGAARVPGLVDVELVAEPAMAPSAFKGSETPWISWLEALPEGGSHALRAAPLGTEGLGPALTVTQGPDLLANWADVPRLWVFPSGALAAAWIVRPYELRVSFRGAGEESWSPPITPHQGTAREFGFPVFFPVSSPTDAKAAGKRRGAKEPRLGLAWLQDGTLRAVEVEPAGPVSAPRTLDDGTCECCRVAAAWTGPDVLLAYRDRSAEQIRDTATVRLPSGGLDGAQPPSIPIPTGWHLAGCPVNGPALAASAGGVSLLQFDGVTPPGRVQLTTSTDGGDTFGPPTRVDLGNALGRVDLVALDPPGGGRAPDLAVAWMEADPRVPGRARLLTLRASPAGAVGGARTVATTTAGRDSGFPLLLRRGEDLWWIWTDPDDDGIPTLRAAHAPARALPLPS